MTSPRFCKDCAFSMPEERTEWNLRCHNDSVNKKDPYSLGSPKTNGTSCTSERGISWIQFPACGMSGKMWERRNT